MAEVPAEDKYGNMLMPGEQLSFTMRPHWRFIVAGVAVGVVVLVVLWLYVGWMGALFGVNARVPQLVGVLVAGIVLVTQTVKPVMQWLFTRYFFTTNRVMTRSGVLTRHAADIPLGQISNIYFRQGVVDRLLGCGSLVIDSSGGDGFTITNVPDVERVDRDVHVLMNGGLPQGRNHGVEGAPPQLGGGSTGM